MKVSFDDCIQELVTNSREAKERFQAWENRAQKYAQDPRKKQLQHEFIKKVKSLVHEYLFQITTGEIEGVLKKSEHALGNLDRKRDSLPEVENFDTPFALQYFFHALLEKNRSIPTFQQFRDSMEGQFRPYYIGDLVNRLQATPYSKEQKQRAVWWRLGKSYYSNFRELYVLAWLREKHGLILKYHLFADLVLAVDGWLGNKVLCIRVPNKKYLDRKKKPPRNFHVIEVDIPNQGYGVLWRPKDDQMERIARKFLEA